MSITCVLTSKQKRPFHHSGVGFVVCFKIILEESISDSCGGNEEHNRKYTEIKYVEVNNLPLFPSPAKVLLLSSRHGRARGSCSWSEGFAWPQLLIMSENLILDSHCIHGSSQAESYWLVYPGILKFKCLLLVVSIFIEAQMTFSG